ncbi:MAG: XdhC family protein [Ignavibacteria bacterium]|nr:XdhC family protein [Ignavibacteria bacterium]
MKNGIIWQFAKNAIEDFGRAALVKVVTSEGSSPGRAGFWMIVNNKGEFRGTVGGGIMESNIIQDSVRLINEGTNFNYIKAFKHKKNVADSSGLICAGSQSCAIMSLDYNDLPIIEQILHAVEAKQIGTLIFSNEGVNFFPGQETKQNKLYEPGEQGNWSFYENEGRPAIIYVIGSGHVGLCVSKIFSAIDYYVVAFDNRSDAFSVRNNTYANELYITPYDKVGDYITEGSWVNIVIVTSERDSDALAMNSVINKEVGYLGLMGSKAKAESIYQELREKGVDEAKICRVVSPIGLNINSSTPDEIAISIAAQIIQLRNQ